MTRILLKPKLRKRRNWRKIGIYTVLIVFILAASGAMGYKTYLKLRRQRMIRHANSLLEHKDYRGAAINAQRILQTHANDVEACIVMAKIFEQGRPDEAIPWRKRVMEQQPHNLENIVALANDQLNAGQASSAERLLAGAEEQGAGNAAYQKVAGLVALTNEEADNAERHLAKAVDLDPKNEELQLLLNTARLKSSEPAKRTEARARLIQLSQNPALKLRALRLVINDMLRRDEAQAAIELSDKLVSDMDATFADRLLRLEISYRLKLPEFSTALRTLQDESLDSNDRILEILSWLQRHKMSLLAIDWAKSIPRKISSDQRLRLSVAEAHLDLRDLDATKELIVGTDWGEYKFIVLALQARLAHEEGRTAQAQSLWDAAILEANKSQDSLVELERVSESWDWDRETELVLWKLTERPYPPDWVFTALERRLGQRLDSEGLRRVWTRKQEIDPTDSVSANNLALSSLLRGGNDPGDHALAARAHEADPANPSFASTYAFSLYRQGKAKEAMRVLSALNEEQLRDPSTAVCYVAVLLANNAKDKALEMVTQIKPTRLFPEEKRLLDKSRLELGLPKS